MAEQKTLRASDAWYERDLRVLVALAEWDSQNVGREYLELSKLVDRLGLTEEDAPWVGKAVHRLDAAGFVSAEKVGDGTPWGCFVTDVTPAGLREAGAWPSAADAATALVNALFAQAKDLEPKDPESAGKLRELAKFLAEQGMDVAKHVAIAVLSHQVGA